MQDFVATIITINTRYEPPSKRTSKRLTGVKFMLEFEKDRKL